MDATTIANMQIASLAEHTLKTALASNHPELTRVADELGADVDIQNEQAISRRFVEKVQRDGCPPSYGTYEACYCEALQAGEVQLPAPIQPPDPAMFQSEEEAQAFGKLSAAQMAEQLRGIQQARAPRNIATDLLTGEGSYRWNLANKFGGISAKDIDESLAALRAGFTGDK